MHIPSTWRSSLQRSAARWSSSLLARNTAWMSLGYAIRLAVQALYFTVVARALGASNYGAFVGVAALVGIAVPFGPLGTGSLLVKQVSRHKDQFAASWGNALGTTMVAGTAFIALLLLLARFFLPVTIPLRLVAVIAVSDIVAMNLVDISGQAFQAFEHLQWTAIASLVLSASRLAAALTLIAVEPHPSALRWGYAYCASTVAAALIACGCVTRKLGAPQFTRRRSWMEVREGLYFSTSLSAQSLYNDIDKTMLARLNTLSSAGIYGAAYRLVEVSFSPIAALLSATYPRFFRHGEAGLHGSMAYGRALLRRVLPLSLFCSVALFAIAPLIPRLLGPQFRDAAGALRWLAVLPVLKTLHYFIAHSLTGAGYQGARTAVQIGVALFNILVNLWLIPAYGARGAAWSSIASDGLLAFALWLTVRYLVRGSFVTSPAD